MDRAGVVGEDGQTHQGVFDAAFLRTVPDIHVYAPTYYDELSDNLDDCIKGENHLYAIRYRAAKNCIARKTTRFPASRFMCSARKMLLSRL